MRLYVFNEKGYYIGVYRDDNIVGFSAEYYIDCSDLIPGKYRFIAWGGMHEDFYAASSEYFIKGKTTFDEALIMLQHAENVITTPVHHIFHSDLPATVTHAKVQRFDMPLVQISNTINIRTEGLPADANAYTFNITDNNNAYKFDRSIASASGTTLKYTAPCTKDKAGQLNASLNLLHLSANRRTPKLQIYNETTGTALYPIGTQSGDLIGLILAAYPQNNFEETHIYDIVLKFESNSDATGFSVTITINHWQVNNQGNELIE
jgi:hypothetical protein